MLILKLAGEYLNTKFYYNTYIKASLQMELLKHGLLGEYRGLLGEYGGLLGEYGGL